MNNKGNCQKCNQRIQNTIHDKCMFCGSDLPEVQRFTEEEKSVIQYNQKLIDSKTKEISIAPLDKGASLDSGFGSDFSGGSCD